MIASPPSRQQNPLVFLREFVRAPFQVGALAPSSRHLSSAMVEGLNLHEVSAVVEFGPGMGAFTQALLPRLGPQTRYLAIDINPTMVKTWQARFPDRTIVQGSVADVQPICQSQGIAQVDVIISGLPWASFPDDLQIATLDGVRKVLRPGGRLVTFGYHIGTVLPAGRRFYRRLPEYFSRITRSGYIWLNLPPAFVVTCYV